MTRTRVLIALWLLLTSWLPVDAQTGTSRYHQKHRPIRPAPRVAYVAICESPSAYAYHSRVCRGLARCTHGVSQVTVVKALKVGYVPCKICY